MTAFYCLVLVLSFACVANAFSHRPSIIRANVISQRSLNKLPSTELFSTKDSKDDEPEERQMSATMKSKLMKEIQNNAGDPNYSQGPILGNPILIISIVVSILAVALKSKGYL